MQTAGRIARQYILTRDMLPRAAETQSEAATCSNLTSSASEVVQLDCFPKTVILLIIGVLIEIFDSEKLWGSAPKLILCTRGKAYQRRQRCILRCRNETGSARNGCSQFSNIDILSKKHTWRPPLHSIDYRCWHSFRNLPPAINRPNTQLFCKICQNIGVEMRFLTYYIYSQNDSFANK